MMKRFIFTSVNVAILASLLFAIYGSFNRNDSLANAAGVNCKKDAVYECNLNGTGCWKKYWYTYESNGDYSEYYSPFKDAISEGFHQYSLDRFFNGEKQRWIRKYNRYGKQIQAFECYDAAFQNCSAYKPSRDEYDARGNLLTEYYSGGAIRAKYTYDSNNRLLTKVSGNYSEKRIYDTKGNKIKELTSCDENFNNCKRGGEFKFDAKNNMTVDRHDCTWATNKCSFNFKYEYTYDTAGNKATESLMSCDNDMANCVCMHRDVYDSRGNKIFEGLHCSSEYNSSATYKNDFNSNNKVTARYKCSSDGTTCTLENKYKYNAYGNVTEEYSVPNNITTKTTYVCR